MVRSKADLENTTATMIGYPAWARPGSNINGVLDAQYERLWSGVPYEAQMFRDSGAIWVGSAWELKYTQIDTTSGNSGSGIYQYVNGYRFVGNHIGVRPHNTNNWGRRWDNTYYNYVVANSQFPNG